MISNENLIEVLSFREQIHKDYLKKKISSETFANRSYFFYRQQRLKFVRKAHDFNSILFNYYYWTAIIERRVYIERMLALHNVHDIKRLDEILINVIKRRNQMVKRLLFEFDDQIKIESSRLVYDDIIELKFSFKVEDKWVPVNIPLFFNADVFDQISIKLPKIEKSNFTFYFPYISFKFPLDIEKK